MARPAHFIDFWPALYIAGTFRSAILATLARRVSNAHPARADISSQELVVRPSEPVGEATGHDSVRGRPKPKDTHGYSWCEELVSGIKKAAVSFGRAKRIDPVEQATGPVI